MIATCACGRMTHEEPKIGTDYIFAWDVDHAGHGPVPADAQVVTVHRLEQCSPPAHAELERIATGDPNGNLRR